MSFQQALLTAVTFPALDAAAKETAYLTVEVAPETSKILSGSGATLKQVGVAKQKMWSPANFRFGIKGIDTYKVSKIDALTVKQTAATGENGENRDFGLEPGKIEFPNLAIMLPESNAGSFYDWHEDFVIRGNSRDESERNGEIFYLASDQKTELGATRPLQPWDLQDRAREAGGERGAHPAGEGRNVLRADVVHLVGGDGRLIDTRGRRRCDLT